MPEKTGGRKWEEFTFLSTNDSSPIGTRKFAASHAAKRAWKKRKEAYAARSVSSSRSSRNLSGRTLLPLVSDERNIRLYGVEPPLDEKGQHGDEQRIASSISLSAKPDNFVDQDMRLGDVETPVSLPVQTTTVLAHPASLLDTSLIDPFATFSEPLGRSTSLLLRHYGTVIVPGMYAGVTKGHTQEANRLCMKWAMESSTAQYAVLYRAESDMRLRWNLNRELRHVSEERPTPTSVCFGDLAIKGLRDDLKKELVLNNLETVTFTMYQLLICEMFLGNMSKAKMHMTGLRALHERTRGQGAIPTPVAAFIMVVSLVMSAALRVPPVLGPQSDDLAALSPSTASMLEDCPHDELRHIGTAFMSPIKSDLLGPEYLKLIMHRRKLILFEEMCRKGVIRPALSDTEWFHTRRWSAEYGLQLIAESNLSPIQEAVRYGLLSYTFCTVFDYQPATCGFSNVLVAHLKTSLERSGLGDLWTLNTDLLLWTLFIGAHGAKSRPERGWYVFHIARCLNKLDLKHIEDFTTVLAGFFYHDRTFEPSLRELWEGAHAIRESLSID